MSEIKVNKVSPRTNCGTVQLGDSGDTITIPAGVTITNNGTQTGFGRTGTVNWQTTPKTGNFTAVSGEGYFINTTSSAITMTMPSGSAGAIVSIQDYNKTFDSNNFTIQPASGEKINGGTADGDLGISTEGQGLTFVYVDGTVGWKTVHENEFITGGTDFIVATGGTITESGNCKIHTFTGPGTFTVCSAAVSAPNNVVSYLVVAGGGGGGSGNTPSDNTAGGGGAGGFREYKSPVTPYTASPLDGNPGGTAITVSAQAYPITVGAGGAQQTTIKSNGNDGSNSIFSTITSTGGGGGGASNAPAPGQSRNGRSGGSGGGAAGGTSPSSSGGSGNSPSVSPSQGNDGGDYSSTSPDHASTGGGGAGAAGFDKPGGICGLSGGPGGSGVTTAINGTSTGFAGGGGGGTGVCGCASNNTQFPNGRSPAPGTGQADTLGFGGASGGRSRSFGGSAGTDNKGGGGGGGAGSTDGGSESNGGAGGSGIVIIRYKFQ